VVELEERGIVCQRSRESGPKAAAREIPDALLQSYLRAVYRVDAGGIGGVGGIGDLGARAIFLTIGETSPELACRLAAIGRDSFAFLSAANPGSAALPDDENRRRHARLVASVAASGRPALAGESYDGSSGGWREASLLVAGIERAAAVALAREFGQVALLYGAIGGPVELVVAMGSEADPEDEA
jgi:hypothetical protein